MILTIAASIAYCLSSNTFPVTALLSSLVSFSCSDGTLMRNSDERKVWSIRKVSESERVRFFGLFDEKADGVGKAKRLKGLEGEDRHGESYQRKEQVNQ